MKLFCEQEKLKTCVELYPVHSLPVQYILFWVTLNTCCEYVVCSSFGYVPMGAFPPYLRQHRRTCWFESIWDVPMGAFPTLPAPAQKDMLIRDRRCHNISNLQLFVNCDGYSGKEQTDGFFDKDLTIFVSIYKWRLFLMRKDLKCCSTECPFHVSMT